MTDYHLIRSKRKTIAIHITKDAAVEVRAPLKVTKSEIDRFVASKQEWIDTHLALCKQSVQNKSVFQLNYGDTVLLQGRAYSIVVTDGNRAGFDGESFFMPPGLSTDEIKHAVIQIYKMVAKNVFTQKGLDYAKQMDVTPTAIKVNGAKTRWGSCSGKNSLNFSWLLVMADDDVIDYVVVHELAHIKEHNHSAKFWAVVADILPDYKQRQSKLKQLQKRLINEDWD